MKAKSIAGKLPHLVRCYQCIEEHVPHLYLIDKAYPVILHSTFSGTKVKNTGGAVPVIKRVSETIYLCPRHFKLIIINQKFSKPEVKSIEPESLNQNHV